MILSAKSIQLILMLDLNPSFILIVNENGLDLYEIGQIHSIQFDRRQKLMIDGRIFFFLLEYLIHLLRSRIA
ncbi:hypothetical protein QR98_0006370 [Sarcoptes scabiei]|uniref:Uncharacterized protein n=1 Tax=Sarcoptes scabiei TaxID=52283 RepID=A0A131ZTY9_SARSC|nr:hypothetical protein QR98_0006370 [Sarcoptes scabiei]